MILTRNSGSILKVQDLHWNIWTHTRIPSSTLKYHNLHWNLWIFTGKLDPHWKSSIHARIPASTLETQDPPRNPVFTLDSQVPHLYHRIYTEIPGTTLQFKDPHWNFSIHTITNQVYNTEKTWSIEIHAEAPHFNTRIRTGSNPRILIGISGPMPESQDPHYKSRLHIEIQGSILKYHNPN